MKNDERTARPTGAAPESAGRSTPAPSFEAAMARLAEIVTQLEAGDLSLEASLQLFEEGMGLSKRAGDLLDQAQRKVEALTRARDGSLGTAPFDVDTEDRE